MRKFSPDLLFLENDCNFLTTNQLLLHLQAVQVECVVCRQQTYWVTGVVHYRNMSEAPFVHEMKRMSKWLVAMYGLYFLCHDDINACRFWNTPRCDRPKYDIPLGANSDQCVVLNDKNG